MMQSTIQDTTPLSWSSSMRKGKSLLFRLPKFCSSFTSKMKISALQKLWKVSSSSIETMPMMTPTLLALFSERTMRNREKTKNWRETTAQLPLIGSLKKRIFRSKKSKNKICRRLSPAREILTGLESLNKKMLFTFHSSKMSQRFMI